MMTGILKKILSSTLITLFHFRFITCLELAKVMGDLGERLSDEEVEQRIGKKSQNYSANFMFYRYRR